MTNAGKRILHVDDDDMILKITAGLLSDAGYAVESALGGQQAWDRIRCDLEAFDIVITDLQMPNFDGWWLVQRLTERNFTGCIIVFSGALDEDTMAKFSAAGVGAIVYKGDSIRALLKVMENVARGGIMANTQPHLRLKQSQALPAQLRSGDRGEFEHCAGLAVLSTK